MSRRIVGWLLWGAGPYVGVALWGAVVCIGTGVVIGTSYPDYLVVGILGAYAALLRYSVERWQEARRSKKLDAHYDELLRGPR